MPGSIFVQSVEAISAKAFFMRGLTFSYNAQFFSESKIMFLSVFPVLRSPAPEPIPQPHTKLTRIFILTKGSLYDDFFSRTTTGWWSEYSTGITS